MTQKKQLPEQMAFHTYRHPAVRAASIQGTEQKRNVYREEHRKERSEASYTSQRVVTVPEADPSTAWNTFSLRRSQLRREQLRRPRTYVKTAPRTFAQTGMWASSGRMRAIRAQSAQLSAPVSSPVPMRSGRLERKRKSIWRLLGALFTCVLLVVAVNFSLTNSTFRIKQVDIVGTHDEVLMHTIQNMGVEGQNIFLVNMAALTERIEAIPLIASANVSRQLPDQLVVSIVERTPALLWQTARGTFSIDGQGVVIAPVNTTAGGQQLQRIVDISKQQQGKAAAGSSLRPGESLNQSEITFAMLLLSRLPREVGLTTFKLYYDGTIYASDENVAGLAGSGGSYIVESPDGWKAYLGDATDDNPLDNRLLELQQILALAQKQQLNLATIDLRYGLHPVYTLK